MGSAGVAAADAWLADSGLSRVSRRTGRTGTRRPGPDERVGIVVPPSGERLHGNHRGVWRKRTAIQPLAFIPDRSHAPVRAIVDLRTLREHGRRNRNPALSTDRARASSRRA